MRRKFKTSVYQYTDYRQFLIDYFNEQKRLDPKFSYRKLATQAGYNSSGLFLDIIRGRTNIQSTVIAKLTRGIGLTSREAVYFENLVRFNQARDMAERNTRFNRMLSLLAGPARKLRSSQYRYYSNWHYAAIRELLAVHDFRGDYAALARELTPAISAQNAKSAISFLVKNGFIKKDADGRYHAVHQTLTSGPEVMSLNVANFQRNMMDMAKEAIDRFPAKHRNISTLTFSASSEAMKAVKAEIDACRTRVRGIIEQCTDETRVYQFNLQLFPLSREKGAAE